MLLNHISNTGNILENMSCLIVLSVFLSALTNCDMVNAGEGSTNVEKLTEVSITHSTESLSTRLISQSLRPALSSITLSYFSPTTLQISETMTSITPKEYSGTLDYSSIPLQTQKVDSITYILPTSLEMSVGFDTAVDSKTTPMASSILLETSSFQSKVSIQPSSARSRIPPLHTEYMTTESDISGEILTTESDLSGEVWRTAGTLVTNVKSTPSLPFTPVTQSTDLYHLHTNSLNMRTANIRTATFSNSDTKSDVDLHATLSEISALQNSIFYLSLSSSSTATQSGHSLSDSNSNLTLSSQHLTLSTGQLTNSSHSSASTSSFTSLEPSTTYSVKDTPNVVGSNKKDSIYPFSYTFTSSSTSSLVFVMPVIVCVVLGIMIFAVFKRWHFYCKLKKYRLRSSNTTESVLSQTLQSGSPKLSTSATAIANQRAATSRSLQRQGAADKSAVVPPPKRAANTSRRNTPPDNINNLRQYKPGLEYFNRGFQYSPDCPIHGRRASSKTSTQAVIEV